MDRRLQTRQLADERQLSGMRLARRDQRQRLTVNPTVLLPNKSPT
jgi:hypothetical protein